MSDSIGAKTMTDFSKWRYEPVTGFGRRLRAAVQEHGPLVAGIDPHAQLLEAWGTTDDAAGLRVFARTCLEAFAGHVAAIKPQAAFFERHGAAGMAVLEELLADARERGLLTILDAKRGDIGSTMGAYADAFLRPGAPFEADALTVSPYLGFGSLDPAVDLARESGKGLFVLALTSNPAGPQVQHARGMRDTPVARIVAEESERAGGGSADRWGDIGLVVGATVGSAFRDLGLEEIARTAPLLAPGFGAQGAGPAQMVDVFGSARDRVLVSVSRDLLRQGPDPDGLMTAARTMNDLYRDAEDSSAPR